MTIALPARAKLNFDLAVLGRRNDGFHEVRTTLQAIDLHDLVTLAQGDHTALTLSGRALEDTRTNSCLIAHAALEHASKKTLPTQIHLHKRIPPGAGLGGASSDAATTLRGLAALHHLAIDLAPIAEQLGADVPFFLKGGTAMAEGRGERLTPVPTVRAWFAIAWPEFELLTPDVYRAWDEMPGDPPNELAKAAAHVEPRLNEFAAELGKGWQMTGSGSAFFRRCADETEARQSIATLRCWTAVAQAIGPWA
ncbi:MAG: 4-(cytidine 5'-diphospho)-2-C-methyl-D-erythritol kinase [Candidatus Dormiibacterota bacterium]